MRPSAPSMSDVNNDTKETMRLMERLSKNPGVYKFVDLSGNTKNINLFEGIMDKNASKQQGVPMIENLYKRVQNAFGKRVKIFRRCYPDISQVLPENIPNDKLIYKGDSNQYWREYNRKHNIKPIDKRGFEMYTPTRDDRTVYSVEEENNISFSKNIFVTSENIPELIAKRTNENPYDVNDRIKGKNILDNLDIYRDTECIKNKDDLIEVTHEFRRNPTLLVNYAYDGEIIPFRQVVNGVPKYSPAILPIDNFIIYYEKEDEKPKKKGWFG